MSISNEEIQHTKGMSISNNKKKERINYSIKRHTTLSIPPRKPSLPSPRKKLQKQTQDLTLSPKIHQKQKKKKSKNISHIFLFSSHTLLSDTHKREELEKKLSYSFNYFKLPPIFSGFSLWSFIS